MKNMINKITAEILSSKKTYFDNFAKKLCEPKVIRKAYWDILKSFSNWKKSPMIPSLFLNYHFSCQLMLFSKKKTVTTEQ